MLPTAHAGQRNLHEKNKIKSCDIRYVARPALYVVDKKADVRFNTNDCLFENDETHVALEIRKGASEGGAERKEGGGGEKIQEMSMSIRQTATGRRTGRVVHLRGIYI